MKAPGGFFHDVNMHFIDINTLKRNVSFINFSKLVKVFFLSWIIDKI